MRVVMVLLIALAAASSSLAADRFTDPRGDVGDAPDVTAVTLSHDDRAVAIAVDFGSAPPLGYDEDYTDMLLVGIHTDEDLSRSDVEFWTGVHGVDLDRGLVVAAAGADSQVVGYADVTVEGTSVTLEIERALLGDPDEIAVAVAAGREYLDGEEMPGEGDFAPASGAYRHVLADDGGTPWLGPVVAGLGAAAAGAVVVLARRRSRRRHQPALAG